MVDNGESAVPHIDVLREAAGFGQWPEAPLARSDHAVQAVEIRLRDDQAPTVHVAVPLVLQVKVSSRFRLVEHTLDPVRTAPSFWVTISPTRHPGNAVPTSPAAENAAGSMRMLVKP